MRSDSPDAYPCLTDVLDPIVDAFGIGRVLKALAVIAGRRAARLRASSCADDPLAQVWDRYADGILEASRVGRGRGSPSSSSQP